MQQKDEYKIVNDKVAGDPENNKINDKELPEGVQENKKEDKDEQNSQGKSTGINTDQTSNNIDNKPEIENENVQGSAPSPNATDENVQNINDNMTNSEENQEITQASTPASELQVTEDNDNSQHENSQSAQCQQENDEQENDQQDNHEEPFESEYVNGQNNSETNKNDNKEESIERSHTPDSKPPEKGVQGKKHITLKRSPSHQRLRRSSSPLEDGEIKEPQEKSKKITLKRHTSDDSNSDFINKIVINRRASCGDDKLEKRRQSVEERTHIVIARPTKLVKPVKLNRHVSSPENTESLLQPRISKIPWGKTNWLENISATSYKIDVDSIKIVCPVLEFLNETEVKLECNPRERTKSENEPVTKKVEEEEKTEDESEKEQTEEEESPEEQKIEAKPNIIALNRKISIVEDTAAKLQPPPSPAKNPVSEILYITNLVRPFTLKQLKELLERTGRIKEGGFWTDRIKSKCYVQYETTEQAETTRNALHGVNWPIGNGKQLMIEYATEDDMEKAKNPVSLPSPVIPEKFPQKENKAPEVIEKRDRERDRKEEKEPERERRWEPSEREWNKSRDHHRKHSRSPSRGRDKERAKKHSRKSYTPEDVNRKKHKKQDDSVPQKLMDDLFLKTKTTPSIYWQPLTPQEIATKQHQRILRMEEHKRRIEENKGRFKERDRRGTYRRR